MLTRESLLARQNELQSQAARLAASRDNAARVQAEMHAQWLAVQGELRGVAWCLEQTGKVENGEPKVEGAV